MTKRCYLCDRPAVPRVPMDVPLCARCIVARADELMEGVQPSGTLTPENEFKPELQWDQVAITDDEWEKAEVILGIPKITFKPIDPNSERFKALVRNYPDGAQDK